MELTEIREMLNALDDALSDLFTQRMALSEEVAYAKRLSGKPIRDPAREQAIIDRLTAKYDPKYARPIEDLYRTIFEISRNRQKELLDRDEDA